MRTFRPFVQSYRPMPQAQHEEKRAESRQTGTSPMTKTTCEVLGPLLALSEMSAQAPTTGAFPLLDRDKDRELSQVEFHAFSREIFTLWDTDADGNIDKDELSRRIFSLWDIDGDGAVTLP